MDRSSDKLYHKHHHDSRTLLETYFSRNPDRAFKDDTLRAPMEKLRKAFNMGHLTGKLLIDISAGPLIHHLYFACEYFQEIILMRTNEQCIIEIMEWHDDRTRAFCWEHMTAHVTNLEGRSDECEEKEMKLKSAITHVMKFDFELENLTDPIGVPLADCVITTLLLDKICKDQNDYMRILRKILTFLKPGGHLISLGVTNTSMVGGHRFYCFTYDEHFARDALVREGMTILQCEVTPRKSESPVSDFGGVLFIIACKQK
ncbi:nicotinamide N-methyltransferase-like isoform X1 [Hyperolius riggenbachi]|uniref:nicotinamide N-methyltransferase-like isoform X1 n=1 Tax=Hyperolius riggenbachi TaxID=752182 RepID=UPI0035A33EAF